MEIAGYEVKQGKYISFKAKDRERFIRGKTLGGYYAEDSIKERISKKAIHRPKKESRRINLIIDIQNCIKAQESKGYEHWSKIYNLKQAAKTLNFLTENNLATYEDLEKAADKIHSDFDALTQKIKSAERQINENAIRTESFSIVEKFSHLSTLKARRAYMHLLILYGIPFGIRFMFTLPIFIGNSGVSIFMTAANIAIGEVIGGIILIWKLIVAIFYVPYTAVKLIMA